MKKGFTLIELLIVLAIIAILVGLIGGALGGCSRNEGYTADQLWRPNAVRARAEEEQAAELRRANELKERELELRAQGK